MSHNQSNDPLSNGIRASLSTAIICKKSPALAGRFFKVYTDSLDSLRIVPTVTEGSEAKAQEC